LTTVFFDGVNVTCGPNTFDLPDLRGRVGPSETNESAYSWLQQMAWDRWNSPAAKRAALLERAKKAREKKAKPKGTE
jgi:hypothetical protein